MVLIVISGQLWLPHFLLLFQAHFSPGGAALGAPLQSSLQTVDPQIAAAAAAAAARYNPQVQQACSGTTF